MSVPLGLSSRKDHGRHLPEDEAVVTQKLYAPLVTSSRGPHVILEVALVVSKDV